MAGFKNLEDLVGDLGAGLVKLRAGELEPEELTPMVEDARELCDRLILLRFKAHEFAYEVRKKSPEGSEEEEALDRQPVRPFRIGAAYQTSLIDAIEEVSREQAEQGSEALSNSGAPDLFDVTEPQKATPMTEEDGPERGASGGMTPSGEGSAQEDSATSLAHQMENQAISDLRTAFSLGEKYECIKALFQDDAMLFDRVLEALDEAGDVQLALHWLNQHVPESETWDEEDPAVARFLDKLQRRYA